jgi:EAL domain-containing protein (putative c-di-GMP-specific phosphodiesterase class I)
MLTARAAGKRFPVSAEALIAAEPVPAQFGAIEMAIKVGAALVIGALLGFGWFGGESRAKRGRAQPSIKMRTAIAYRPVIEITNGTIVGIDVVAEGATDSLVSDIHFVDRVLTEAAPILRVHPTLKLSLPSISDPRALTRLASSLAQALPRFSVQPGQVVAAATPAADQATATALDNLRGTGIRLSLDGIASGGAGVMALGRHRPDFITIGGELAADPESDSEALTILEALVGIARDLDVGVIMRDVAEIEQIERLRGVGITTATGPAFGPPLKAHLISALVAAATLDAEKRVRVA